MKKTTIPACYRDWEFVNPPKDRDPLGTFDKTNKLFGNLRKKRDLKNKNHNAKKKSTNDQKKHCFCYIEILRMLHHGAVLWI